VNPIALNAIDWKFMAIYYGWLCFQFGFIYFMYPEIHCRTLGDWPSESLKINLTVRSSSANLRETVFEDKEYADRAVIAVEKRIYFEEMAVLGDEIQKRVASQLEITGKNVI
jgi:hypothetical protein